MRKPLIAGNWKLNKTIPEAQELAATLKQELSDCPRVDILVCPPFVALYPVSQLLAGGPIAVGGQDLYWKDSGAFTGAVSGPMLKAAGCSFVIVGHSERRQIFGDSDEAVNKKLSAALAIGLTPILCVGETLEKREQKVTKEFLRKQLGANIKGIPPDLISRIVVAYEPIWAIGTGVTASPLQAAETHHFIRDLFRQHYDDSIAAGLRILYGGSAKPDNVRELLAQGDVDGFLIGGASLQADSFVRIVQAASL